MNGDGKPKPVLAISFLAALCGISVGFNIFLGLKTYKPKMWQELVLAMVKPPVPRPDDHVRGPADAHVTIIEYSDFQCPFCAQIHSSLKKLTERSEIRWIYRNYPLSSIHPRAIELAEAAECADDQGKFWEYADELFNYQHQLGPEVPLETFLINLGEDVGLNEGRFQTCRSNLQFDARIRAQMAEGASLRIEATPTIFVNGKRQIGSLPFERLEQMVGTSRNYRAVGEVLSSCLLRSGRDGLPSVALASQFLSERHKELSVPLLRPPE
jgi:predicted DsbA family dithiol-disulfide isomerase